MFVYKVRKDIASAQLTHKIKAHLYFVLPPHRALF